MQPLKSNREYATSQADGFNDRSNKKDTSIHTSSTSAAWPILLCIAAKDGDIKAVKKMAANGYLINSVGTLGMNPLQLAAMNGHFEVCHILRKFGADIDCANKAGKTPLHLAASNGCTKVVNYLLHSGAYVDPVDMLKMTPLHFACARGYLSIVQILLKFNANPRILNKFEKSPLYLAKENGFVVITDLISSYLNKKDEDDMLKMCHEIKEEIQYSSSESLMSIDSDVMEDSTNLSMETYTPEVICVDNNDFRRDTSLNDEDNAYSMGNKWKKLSFPSVICEDDNKTIPQSLLDKQVKLTANPKETFSINTNWTENSFPKVICVDDAKPTIIPDKKALKDVFDNSLGDKEPADSTDVKMNNLEYSNCFLDEEEDRLQDSLLTSLTELEEAVFKRETHKLTIPNIDTNEANELLRAQAALSNMDEPWKLLQQAIICGRTIQLTEAGKQALAMIKPDPIILPFRCRRRDCNDDENEKQFSKRRMRSPQFREKYSGSATTSSCSNACNAVILRKDSKDIFRGKNDSPDDSHRAKECLRKSGDWESSSSELDNNLQILSDLYESGQLENIFKKS